MTAVARMYLVHPESLELEWRRWVQYSVAGTGRLGRIFQLFGNPNLNKSLPSDAEAFGLHLALFWGFVNHLLLNESNAELNQQEVTSDRIVKAFILR